MSLHAPGRVLVVDDEVELTNALVDMLNKQGYQAQGFTNGNQAIELLKNRKFDILLADLMMPEISGMALLKAALELDPSLICVLMTGQGTVQTAVEAMKAGAFDYILKPFKMNLLLTTLQRSMDIRRLRAENLQLRELVNIYELGRMVSAQLDIEEILRQTCQAALQVCQADEASILLPDGGAAGDSQGLMVAAAAGDGLVGLVGQHVPANGSVSGWVAREHEMLVTTGPLDTGRFPASHPREVIQSALSLPVMLGDRPVGVINVNHINSSAAFSEGQVKGLGILAHIAASAMENARLFEQTLQAYTTTIEGWSRALDLRDRETEGHTQRVTAMTLRLARAMNVLSDEELVHLQRGALLHDIGKMGIPDEILHKAGNLNAEEETLMRRHPVYAYQLLSPIAYLRPALDIPYYHHERWDGGGYPTGIQGEQIPLAARIFAVVDVWDALRSDRPYRSGWPEEQVLDYIRTESGKHFDPQVVEAFLRLLSNGPA